MTNNADPINKDYKYFLNDDKFIKWRLLQTKELAEYWTNYEKDYPEHKAALAEATEKFKKVLFNNFAPSTDQYDILLESIRKDTYYHKRKTRKLRYFAASAACIIVLITSSLYFYFDQFEIHTHTDQFVGESHSSVNIQFISADKSISLSQDAEIIISKDGKAAISTKEGERVEDMNLSKSVMNKLIVPYGKRTSLVLADGTKIFLNSGTELEFPSIFNGSTRDINVSGEVYIDVVKDKNKPFNIHTYRSDIHVVGTKFNVTAYKDDTTESIVLIEGSVIVNTQNAIPSEMSPNDMLIVSSDGVKKNKVDVYQYISWKDGILSFNKATLSDIFNKIGRYYNVSFEKNNHIDFIQKTYSGKLILSDNLDDVMNSISAFSSTIYTRENNNIIIRNK